MESSESPLAPDLIASFPLERCARIAASIDASPVDEPRILETNGLDAASWEQLGDHWQDAQMRELEGGGQSSLQRSDDAYLSRLEEERGTITADEYAQLVVAAERGTQESALEALELPEAASVVLERAWCRRCVDDPKLAEATSLALKRARAADVRSAP